MMLGTFELLYEGSLNKGWGNCLARCIQNQHIFPATSFPLISKFGIVEPSVGIMGVANLVDQRLVLSNNFSHNFKAVGQNFSSQRLFWGQVVVQTEVTFDLVKAVLCPWHGHDVIIQGLLPMPLGPRRRMRRPR